MKDGKKSFSIENAIGLGIVTQAPNRTDSYELQFDDLVVVDGITVAKFSSIFSFEQELYYVSTYLRLEITSEFNQGPYRYYFTNSKADILNPHSELDNTGVSADLKKSLKNLSSNESLSQTSTLFLGKGQEFIGTHAKIFQNIYLLTLTDTSNIQKSLRLLV
jgi:hypothetical protein